VGTSDSKRRLSSKSDISLAKGIKGSTESTQPIAEDKNISGTFILGTGRNIVEDFVTDSESTSEESFRRFMSWVKDAVSLPTHFSAISNYRSNTPSGHLIKLTHRRGSGKTFFSVIENSIAKLNKTEHASYTCVLPNNGVMAVYAHLHRLGRPVDSDGYCL